MKSKTTFSCNACGYTTPKWVGQCPECSAWNSMQEGIAEETSVIGGRKKQGGIKTATLPIHSLVTTQQHLGGDDSLREERFVSGIGELDRVFGGGIMKGSLNLLAGEPGIGKSTLTLMLCQALASLRSKVLYVSGEESMQQIARRGKRLGISHENIHLLHEYRVEHIIATALAEQVGVLVVDSIQVMFSEELMGQAGSIAQIRFTTELLMEAAKRHGITVILIGHVNKEGNIAGPKVLEHLVDALFVLEGDRSHILRLLRTEKNRFGPTDEVGVFTMKEDGLQEVLNPSQIFLEGRFQGAPGSIVTATMEGTRSFLVELQALTTYTKFGYPKRAQVGFDLNRLQLLLAVLGKYTSINLDSYDVYVNVVGGLRVRETVLDVPVCLALMSSKMQKALPSDLVAFGEIGLAGELRAVSHVERRVREAVKYGMKQIVLPHHVELPSMEGIVIHRVRHVRELTHLLV